MTESEVSAVPEFRLIARDPQELEASRQKLIVFFAAKLDELQKERGDLDANLTIAQKFPIRTQPLKAQLKRVQKRIDFYTKARAAVEAGFHIIPNFDADVFAIRTDRDARGRSGLKADAQWAINSMPTQQAQALPVGEGRYVSPVPSGLAYDVQTEERGQAVTRYYADVIDYADAIDFPFLFARPEVLTATQQLMAAKIFDELGALPKSQRNADPMVVGIIKESSARDAKRMTFLVVWFLDTKTL